MRSQADLQAAVEREAAEPSPGAHQVVADLLDALERGAARAAEPADGGWRVNGWVKKGILLAFKIGVIVESPGVPSPFTDKDTLLPVRAATSLPQGVRLVPGGSAVRRGAHVGARVTIMPPAYVNVGAFVDADAMIDSHALVGSCAQIGRRVHLSAAAQVGGVLEPVGALPVVVEDEAFVGGGVGLYEGVRVGARAVLAAGVILTGSSVLYDVPNGRVLRREGEAPLAVPPGAVVVPGARALPDPFSREHGLALHAPVIVKYRDASTDARTTLEEALR